MSPAVGRARHRALAWSAAGLLAVAGHLPLPAPAGNDQARNPYLGQPAAIDDGERIYRSRCIGCHFRSGGRGPNIFRPKLSERQFLEIVINGGKTGMPAWGSVLSADEIWRVHAFLMSRDQL
jgi:mono/diheme cytochrome c family protein